MQAYPLQWPAGKPRTRNPQKSRFGSHSTFTIHTATRRLVDELRRLNASNVVISTNVELRNDGLPHSGRRPPTDTGVAVYFMRKGELRGFACDKWLTVEENMAAITHTIDALRGIERWGGAEMVDQAFSGFTALPSYKTVGRHWTEVIGCTAGDTLEEITRRYREKAKTLHPDATHGDTERMAELNVAYEEAKRSTN